jgi:hypothetical protein
LILRIQGSDGFCCKPNRRSIATASTEYLQEIKLTKKPKTFAAYFKSLDYFSESCPKIYLEDLERRDLLNFAAFLRDEKELHPRTCWNKFCERDVLSQGSRHPWAGQ